MAKKKIFFFFKRQNQWVFFVHFASLVHSLVLNSKNFDSFDLLNMKKISINIKINDKINDKFFLFFEEKNFFFQYIWKIINYHNYINLFEFNIYLLKKYSF